MADPARSDPKYEVHCAGAIGQNLLRLHQLAKSVGRSEALASAFRSIVERLEQDPMDFGEPLYRLPNLRLQVRTCAVAPLVVQFAVSEDMPIVYINHIESLS